MTSCGQSSWAYHGHIGQLVGLLLVLLLLLLSHVSGGRGEDAWELTVGTIELLEGKEESGTPGKLRSRPEGGGERSGGGDGGRAC